MGETSPVVLQTRIPQSRIVKYVEKPWSEAHVYELEAGEALEFSLCAYNFGSRPVHGTLAIGDIPTGWRLGLGRKEISVAAGETVILSAHLTPSNPAGPCADSGWIELEARFASLPASKLALYFQIAE